MLRHLPSLLLGRTGRRAASSAVAAAVPAVSSAADVGGDAPDTNMCNAVNAALAAALEGDDRWAWGKRGAWSAVQVRSALGSDHISGCRP